MSQRRSPFTIEDTDRDCYFCERPFKVVTKDRTVPAKTGRHNWHQVEECCVECDIKSLRKILKSRMMRHVKVDVILPEGHKREIVTALIDLLKKEIPPQNRAHGTRHPASSCNSCNTNELGAGGGAVAVA